MGILDPEHTPSQDPWSRLNSHKVRLLLDFAGTLDLDLTLRCNTNGDPYVALVRGRCPLCYADPWDEEIRESLRPNTAYIAIWSARYRCRHDLCAAGGVRSGYTNRGRPRGLTLAEVLKELGVKP